MFLCSKTHTIQHKCARAISSEVKKQTHGHGVGCHLLRLSSGLQLTDTNSSVLNSCEISSEAFALPLGGTVFSGLCSLVPGLKTRPLTAWWSQRGRTYMVLFQRWGHVGRMTSQFRLYLKWSWLENKGNCCVLIISLITVNNATIDSEPVVFSSVLLTSEKMGNKEWEKTGCFSYWRDALAHDSSSLNSNVWSSSRQSVIKLSQWKCCSTDKDISGTTIRDSTFRLLIWEFFLPRKLPIQASFVSFMPTSAYISAHI